MNGTALIAIVFALSFFLLLIVPSLTVLEQHQTRINASPGLTLSATGINWGTLRPGENRTVQMEITNTYSKSGHLRLDTSEWNPKIAENYLTITWNAENKIVPAYTKIQVLIHLLSSPLTEGFTTFTNQINVYMIY